MQAGGASRLAALAVAAVVGLSGCGLFAGRGDVEVAVLAEPVGDRMGGIENVDLFAPGAPFHCTGLFDVDPRAAEALVRDRGFVVSWQFDERPNWPRDATPPDGAFVDSVVLLDEERVLLIATPDRRDVRPDRGCPDG